MSPRMAQNATAPQHPNLAMLHLDSLRPGSLLRFGPNQHRPMNHPFHPTHAPAAASLPVVEEPSPATEAPRFAYCFPARAYSAPHRSFRGPEQLLDQRPRSPHFSWRQPSHRLSPPPKRSESPPLRSQNDAPAHHKQSKNFDPT